MCARSSANTCQLALRRPQGTGPPALATVHKAPTRPPSLDTDARHTIHAPAFDAPQASGLEGDGG